MVLRAHSSRVVGGGVRVLGRTALQHGSVPLLLDRLVGVLQATVTLLGAAAGDGARVVLADDIRLDKLGHT